MSSNIEVKLDVLNQKASPALYAASLANRPTASFTGRLFVDSDSPSTGIYRDTGTSWVQVADQGAGTTGTLQQVTTNGSTTNVGISVTANGIGIGTTIPASNRLDIHSSSGINATFNGTGTTNSSLQLQSAGVGKWNIQNNYNSAANDFVVTDVLNTINRLTITNTGVGTLMASLSATKTATYLSGGVYGIYGNDNYTIPASTNFGSGGLIFASLQGIQSFTYGGNASYQNNSLNASVVGINQIQFSSTGTVTMSQAAGIRTMASGIFQNQFLGAVNGTIDYLAGLQVLGNYKASSGLLTVTNAYGLLLNNIDDYSTGFTYTNRWGIYQSGASDINYFAANVLIGSTTDNGQKLQITGTGYFSGVVTINDTTQATSSSTGCLVVNGGLGISKNIFSNGNFISNGGAIAALNGGDIEVYTAGNANYFSLTSPNNGDFLLKVNQGAGAISAINVKNNGNCLVGTTTDNGNKLQINGLTSGQNGFRRLPSSNGTSPTFVYENGIDYNNGLAGLFFGNTFNSNNNVTVKLRTSNDGTPVDALILNQGGNATFVASIAIGNSVSAGVAVASTHKVSILIGGVQYYLLASNV